MRKSIVRCGVFDVKAWGRQRLPPPRLIVRMSFRQGIPWRVGLHQSPPPLPLPRTILEEESRFEKEKSANGKCSNRELSHARGSPQMIVVEIVAEVSTRFNKLVL